MGSGLGDEQRGLCVIIAYEVNESVKPPSTIGQARAYRTLREGVTLRRRGWG